MQEECDEKRGSRKLWGDPGRFEEVSLNLGVLVSRREVVKGSGACKEMADWHELEEWVYVRPPGGKWV